MLFCQLMNVSMKLLTIMDVTSTSNLKLFLEGLGEDINELKDGVEVRHIPIRPKEQQDAE